LSENLYTRNLVEQISFYKHENIYKKGTEKFLKYLQEHYDKEGIISVINIIKSSGAALNFFASQQHTEKLEKIISGVGNFINEVDKRNFAILLKETQTWNELLFDFQQGKEEFFSETPELKPNAVNSYLIALEIYLRELLGDYPSGKISVVDDTIKNDAHLKQDIFEWTIDSTGLMLNYFSFKGFSFSSINFNISPEDIKKSASHFPASVIWNGLKDITEYWMYSDATIEVDEDNEMKINITNDDFELNNLISNSRFISLRTDWQLTAVQNVDEELLRNQKKFQTLETINNELDFLFMFLYLGTVDQEEKLDGIEIRYWLKAYKLLQHEAAIYLERSKAKNMSALNLNKICLCLTKEQWIAKLKALNIDLEKRKKIIEGFTFNKVNSSQDLVDCPLIPFNGYLVVVPSLLSMSDAVQAITSNFMNKNEQLNFKGTHFEDRTKEFLNSKGIINGSIYKKVGKEEYECDLAFILEDELFLVECKAHSQPYKTRQHAKNLKVLFDETLQLNRIADFYQDNIDLVNKALIIEKTFEKDKITRILLVTSMVGSPIFVNGVYIVDESSFTKMINRSAPALYYYEDGRKVKVKSQAFDIYVGELSAEKMKKYLTSPPQIEVTKKRFKKTVVKDFNISIERYREINKDLHFDLDLSQSERELIEDYFPVKL